VTKTVLITLGRLPKALDIARSFARGGYRVIVAEPYRRHLTGASRCVARSYVVMAPAVDREAYLSQLAQIVMNERVDLVVPVSEETMHVAFLRDRLPRHVTVYSMPSERVLQLHDKLRFIDYAQSLSLPVPRTVALGDPRGRDLTASGDVIVKPVLSCSGRGVVRVPQGGDLPDPEARQPAIVQQYLEGTLLSTCTIARDGEVIATVVYRGAVMSGTVAVCFERVDAPPALKAWVRQFVRASVYSGFVSFDFIIDNLGVARAIECNPRATSGLHFIAEDALWRCVVGGTAIQGPIYREERLKQQFYPCLTETQRSLFGSGQFRRNLRLLLSVPDVTWDARDPWPFLSMPFTTARIIALAVRNRTTFGEVATLDVGWYDHRA